MKVVSFSFKPDVPHQRRGKIIGQIGKWKSVRKAVPLLPGAKHPEVSRMYYAYVDDDADVSELTSRLEEVPEIESASVPAERHLA
jgi:hypothetical protein